MRAVKPFAGFVLLLVLFAAGGTVAQAASKRRVDQTFTLGTLRERAGYPKPGSRVVLAGTVRSRFGRGTIVLALTVTVRPSSTSFSFKATSRAFYPRGTTNGAFTGTGTLQRGGRLTLAGHGRYTGGTLFGRARKGYSFSGTAPSPPPPPPPTPPVPCAVPAGWQVVARDSEVVVIEPQAFSEIQEYRYCYYSRTALGFQLLVRNDDSGFLAGAATFSTVDGVALGYI